MAELQQPNIVGNFLAAYSSGLERQQQQQDAAYQRQRQAKADERLDQQWQWQMDDRELAAARARAEDIGAVAQASDTPEKWAVNVPIIMQKYGMQGPIPDFSERGAKIAEALGLKGTIELEFKNRESARLDRVANANIAQSLAAARASNRQGQGGGGLGNAPSGYQWVRNADGTLSQAPIKGGPADPTKKLTESQSKDLAFYQRGAAALAKLDNDRAAAMSSMWNSTFGEAPFGLGNVLQTQSSRQGKQAAAEFLAAILRKDSGAALTKSDFDIYGTIFMPQMGDDPDTLAQKAASRTQALESLKAGLGSAQILARAGAPVTAGDGPPPPLGGGTIQPSATTGAPPAAGSPVSFEGFTAQKRP